jgi:hypothetical protein
VQVVGQNDSRINREWVQFLNCSGSRTQRFDVIDENT